MLNSKIVIRLLVFILISFCTLNGFAQYDQEKVIGFLIKVYDRHEKNLHAFLVDELRHFMKTYQGGYYSAYALHHLGKAYEENGDIAESMACFMKVLFLYPQSPHKSEWAKFIRTSVINYELLPVQKTENVKGDGNDNNNKNTQELFYDYLAFLVKLDHPSLRSWMLLNCREFIQLYPENVKNDQVLFWIANIYEGMGKQIEADVSYLKFGILFPDSPLLPQVLQRRSRISSNRFKNYELATELLNRIVTKFPNSKFAGDALFQMAKIKEKKQKVYKSAIIDYRNLVDSYPKNENVIPALFAIAKINYHKLKDYSKTISAYNEIVEKDSTSLLGALALEKIALIYKKQIKNLRKTVETFERIADLNVNYETAAKKLYLAASICEKDLKDDQKAIYYYQLLIDKYPNHKEAMDIRVKIQHIQSRLTLINSINGNDQRTVSLIPKTLQKFISLIN